MKEVTVIWHEEDLDWFVHHLQDKLGCSVMNIRDLTEEELEVKKGEKIK